MISKEGTLAEELTYRGLVFQHTAETLDEITESKRTIYLGVDPTGDSLHVGHLLPLMIVRRFIEHGHNAIILLGGGTATIGDPSGKTEERTLLDEETVRQNAEKLRVQISDMLGTDKFTMVNNADWFKEASVLDFLRDIGKHFTVNDMLRKESVRRRIEDPDSAISFTEFSYMLLQAYDFYVLNEREGCDLQLGGSDQWGNITAGIELIRKKKQIATHGVTVPLLLDKTTGRKFGKTEGGAVWVDALKTTPYQFYQFWYNIDDESAREYLKYYTLMSRDDIEALEKEAQEYPEKRLTQTRLAHDVTAIIHGDSEAEKVQNVSKAVFSEQYGDLTEDEKKLLFSVVPNLVVSRNEVEKGIGLVDVLVDAKLATSKRDARTLIESNAITLNGKKIIDTDYKVTVSDFNVPIPVLKKGKRDIVLLLMH